MTQALRSIAEHGGTAVGEPEQALAVAGRGLSRPGAG